MYVPQQSEKKRGNRVEGGRYESESQVSGFGQFEQPKIPNPTLQPARKEEQREICGNYNPTIFAIEPRCVWNRYCNHVLDDFVF
jgi:hypothetical protein